MALPACGGRPAAWAGRRAEGSRGRGYPREVVEGSRIATTCGNNGRCTDLGVPRLSPPRRRLTAAGTETIRIVSKCSGATRVRLSLGGKHPLNPFGTNAFASLGRATICRSQVCLEPIRAGQLTSVCATFASAVDSGHPGPSDRHSPLLRKPNLQSDFKGRCVYPNARWASSGDGSGSRCPLAEASVSRLAGTSFETATTAGSMRITA